MWFKKAVHYYTLTCAKCDFNIDEMFQMMTLLLKVISVKNIFSFLVGGSRGCNKNIIISGMCKKIYKITVEYTWLDTMASWKKNLKSKKEEIRVEYGKNVPNIFLSYRYEIWDATGIFISDKLCLKRLFHIWFHYQQIQYRCNWLIKSNSKASFIMLDWNWTKN